MTACTVPGCGAPSGPACTYAACPGRTYKHCSARTSPAQRSKEAVSVTHAARITGQFA